jgi:hypothetical protein
VPRGPKGEKRPADVKARALMIAKIWAGRHERPGCRHGSEKKLRNRPPPLEGSPTNLDRAYA